MAWFDGVDGVSDDAPEEIVDIVRHFERGFFVVVVFEENDFTIDADAADGEFAFDDGYDDGFVRRREGAVDDEDIAGKDVCILHGVAGNFEEESGSFVFYEELVDIHG